MTRKISTVEFEAMLTTRVLSKRMSSSETQGKMREKIKYQDFIELLEIETKSLLRSLELEKILRVRMSRTGRLFLINQISKKVVAEIGAEFEHAGDKIRRPKAILISKYKLPKTIQEF